MSMSQNVQEPVYERVRDRIENALIRKVIGDLPWTMQEGGINPFEKFLVLSSECGEVGTALQKRYSGTGRDNLQHELEDVAAAALAWLFAIEARKQRKAMNMEAPALAVPDNG